MAPRTRDRLLRFIQRLARSAANLLGRRSLAITRGRFIYERILRAVSATRGVPWAINGIEYRIDPAHRERLGHDYDSAATAFLASRTRPGTLAFNVGANVGVHVLQLAHFSGPDGHVVAFEPNPIARAALLRHVYMNNLDARVTVEPYAIGERPGEATLYFSGADGMSRLGQPNPLLDDVTAMTVEVVNMDTYCERRALVPDCIVMDVEGLEIGALKGATRLLLSHRVSTVLVELHPSMWPSCGESPDTFRSFLEQVDLEPISLANEHVSLFAHEMVWLRPRCS